MGAIISTAHLSWNGDGTEGGAAGPVQGATRPWFEVGTGSAGGIDLTLHAGRGAWAGEFTLSGSTLRLSTTGTQSDTFITLGRNGLEARIARDFYEDLAADSAAPTATSRAYFSGQSGFSGDQGHLLVTQAGGNVLAVTALPDQAGLTVFQQTGATSFQHRDTQNDTQALNLAAPVGLASVSQNGATYVYAASSGAETGISAFRLGTAGQLTAVDTLTATDGLWVSNISQLAATSVDGQPFLLVGAAGSGSLSVVEIGAGGTLQVTDHLLDDRNTRFDDITVLETLVVGARTYVAVSGGDDGVSLLSLLPNGQLMHLATLEDTLALGLGSISALSLGVQGGDIHLIASSEVEAGLTHIVYDPGTGLQVAGTDSNNTLSGSAGADVLLDGAGDDRMTGGAGADLFVMAADGTRDTITDFQIGVDRVDVSAWEGLYSTLQIEVRPQTNGADIRYGDERLILRTANGSSLDLQDFLDTDVLGIARLAPPEDRLQNQPLRSGTTEGDLMEGGAQANTLRGLGGNDQIFGMAGNDRLEGGDGSDVLWGGAGRDTLEGGAGHDRLVGGDDHDRLFGGTGADTLEGEDGNDSLSGDSSTDVLYGGNGNDTLVGGTGADTLYGGNGNDRILSNTGVDLVYGGGGHDWISPGNGVDVVYGEGGNDTIIGRTGWDTLDGGTGDDALYGSEGRDMLTGGAGDDFLSGGFGFDSLRGGDGNDDLYGNIGADTLHGENGNDALYGATGNDLLVGGDGNDRLFGAQGRDTLEGGAGDDYLRGGTLADVFIFDVHDGEDTVSGMEMQDQIHLSTALTQGLTDAREIVQTYGRTVQGDAALSFTGGDLIIFEDGITHAQIIEVLYSF